MAQASGLDGTVNSTVEHDRRGWHQDLCRRQFYGGRRPARQQVAMWDGARWWPLGGGLPAKPGITPAVGVGVLALAFYQGQLYVGGDFRHNLRRPEQLYRALGRHRVVWPLLLQSTMQCSTLVADNDYLYAGGGFHTPVGPQLVAITSRGGTVSSGRSWWARQD